MQHAAYPPLEKSPSSKPNQTHPAAPKCHGRPPYSNTMPRTNLHTGLDERSDPIRSQSSMVQGSLCSAAQPSPDSFHRWSAEDKSSGQRLVAIRLNPMRSLWPLSASRLTEMVLHHWDYWTCSGRSRTTNRVSGESQSRRQERARGQQDKQSV